MHNWINVILIIVLVVSFFSYAIDSGKQADAKNVAGTIYNLYWVTFVTVAIYILAT